jgi:hypothetical protein
MELRVLRRRAAIAAALLVALALAGLLALMLLSADLRYWSEFFSPTPFEAPAWRSGGERERGAMVRDLIDRELLIGKTRAEAIEILGPPEDESDERLLYVIDIGQRFASTPWRYALHVRLDAQSERVREVWYSD